MAVAGAQPDYSQAWIEYYRSLGMFREAEMIEHQTRGNQSQQVGACSFECLSRGEFMAKVEKKVFCFCALGSFKVSEKETISHNSMLLQLRNAQLIFICLFYFINQHLLLQWFNDLHYM